MVAPNTLLLVNDDPKTLKLLDRILECAGFSRLLASNGFDALVMARRHKPDVIVSDILMRGMNGLELCRAIREDPVLCCTPVILYSNLSPTREDFALIQSVGANAFVLASYDASELLKKIHELLA